MHRFKVQDSPLHLAFPIDPSASLRTIFASLDLNLVSRIRKVSLVTRNIEMIPRFRIHLHYNNA